MFRNNKGYDPDIIGKLKDNIEASDSNHIIVDSEDNSEEYVNFNFVGVYEGKEVIYDAVMYTLKLHHLSEIYEIAEHKAAQNFPEFRKIKYEEDENGDLEALDDLEEEIGLFMAEAISELEDEGSVKVREHIETDASLNTGIGLEVGLNVVAIDKKVIEQFVNDYNEDTIELDKTWYTFHAHDDKMPG